MQPRLIIFDWDGALAGTTNPIIATFRQSSADCGLPVPEADHIRSLIGHSPPAIARHPTPNADGRVQAAVAETYALHYPNPNDHNMKLLDSAVPCLNILRRQGYLLAAVTGKGRTGLDRAIGQTGIAHFWTATTRVSEQPSKPAPEVVFALCGVFGLMPPETLVVGDTTYGLQMAASAKASAVAMATDAHTKAQFAAKPCLAMLDGLAELPALLAAL